MRASISALGQAEDNVRDGISLVQTADGAMQEIHDMLNRLTALSAKAANGTLSQDDRDHIQAEIDEILDEITRIKDSSEFNGIPLLQGDSGTVDVAPEIKGGLPDWVGMSQTSQLGDIYTTTENYELTVTDASGNTTTTTGSVQVDHASAKLDFSSFKATTDQIDSLLEEDVGFYTTCCSCTRHYSIKFTDSAKAMESSGLHYIYYVDVSGLENETDPAAALVQRIIDSTQNGNPQGHYTKLVADGNQLVVYDQRPFGDAPSVTDPTLEDATWPNWKYSSDSDDNIYPGKYGSLYGVFGEGVAYDKSTLMIGDIVLQIGESGDDIDQMQIDLPDMSFAKLGFSALSVSTADNAKAAITLVKNAIDYVSQERARMGAYQNRLEHTGDSLSVQRENLTRAEAQIRDADIAEEMMAYTKNNILGQSAQAMLAQANQVPQGVLQLMQ